MIQKKGGREKAYVVIWERKNEREREKCSVRERQNRKRGRG